MTSLQEIQGKFNTTDVDKKETFFPFPIKNDAILYIKIPVKPGSLLVFSWDRGGIQERCTLYTKELYWAESLDNYNFPFSCNRSFWSRPHSVAQVNDRTFKIWEKHWHFAVSEKLVQSWRLLPSLYLAVRVLEIRFSLNYSHCAPCSLPINCKINCLVRVPVPQPEQIRDEHWCSMSWDRFGLQASRDQAR